MMTNGMSLELRTVCDRCYDEETIPDPISLLDLSHGFVVLRCLMCVMDLRDTSRRTAGDQRHRRHDTLSTLVGQLSFTRSTVSCYRGSATWNIIPCNMVCIIVSMPLSPFVHITSRFPSQ